MPPTVSASARIDIRTTPEMKSLAEKAAALSGMSLSEFIKAALLAKSQEVFTQHETRMLADRDRDIFLMVLEEPALPNLALRTAAKDFKNAILDGSLKP